MPITPTYPGVYIEEIPSGVRTITGVSTSITAFIGYTRKGPIDKAEEVSSFADFDRKFGGLSRESLLSYAVQHFFMNGGQRAYVVKVAEKNTPVKASATLKSLTADVDVIQVNSRVPGAWANGTAISIDHDTPHPDSTFNLRVMDLNSGQSEAFLGVTMNSRSRRNVDKVINQTSQIIEVKTIPNAINLVSGKRGSSRSAIGITHALVDADHRHFTITLNEDDGPKPVVIYDGSPGNRPANLVDLAKKITDAVKAMDPGREPYKSFTCIPNSTDGTLTLTSGEQGDTSIVRISGGGSLDAARALKLGVMNGGREIDAAADIRPSPMGTTSGDLEQLPQFSSNRTLLVTIDGDGPHKVEIFRSGDAPPAELKALQQLIQNKLQSVKPKRQGSMIYKGIIAKVVGSSIQIVSGSTDSSSLVIVENDRVMDVMNEVFFRNPSDGWTVGDNGTILTTTDGGVTWTPQTSGTTKALRSVYMESATKGWTVGDNGTILTTTDGGVTWTPQTSGTTKALRSVYMESATKGWAVGDDGTILVTDGAAWTPQTSGTTKALRGVYMESTTKGWAVGDDGTILVTDGAAWTPQTSGTTKALRGVYMESATKGWAVGDDGTIQTTTDGGVTWTPQTSGTTKSLRSVYIVSATKGWAVGDDGTIQTTTDGGVTWTPQTSGTTKTLRGVYMESATKGWAVGDDGTILATTDGGTTWSEQQCPLDNSADDLKLSAAKGCQNIKQHSLGIGKILGAQSAVTPGQDGLPPKARDYEGNEAEKSGMYALLDVDLFNILCLPGITDFDTNDSLSVLSKAEELCKRRRAFLIIDCPDSWRTLTEAVDHLADFDSVRSENAAMYYPRVQMPDSLDNNRLRTFPPCGIVAGICARTDSMRGVWKAPAGQEASMGGVGGLVYKLNDQENGVLNPLGLNCLRLFPVIGPVVWGARTLHGADVLASEWKYIPVRRIALFIEESLYRGTKWAVFEPNDEPLWAQLRLNIGAFMHNLFRQGAFKGQSPREAYFVKCDKETTTQNDINLGTVNILIGFAPLKPAEFVIIKIQQMTGQVQA